MVRMCRALFASVRVGESWRGVVEREVAQPYFAALRSFLAQEEAAGAEIFPPRPQVLRALDMCPLDQVRVVVLGQDPYHGPGQADGLAFSTPRGAATPPSLRNVLGEAARGCSASSTAPPAQAVPKPPAGEAGDTGGQAGGESRLAPWARQGVLLLNTVLTVRRGEPRSHRDRGWEPFTDALLRAVLEERRSSPPPLVFMLWGRDAHAKAEALGIRDGADDGVHVLAASHPSPLAARRPSGDAGPFVGCGHFARANELLVAAGHPPIAWEE